MIQAEFDAAFLTGTPRYLNDCQRIVDVAACRDIKMTLHQAEVIWDDYSDALCAGWLTLPDDDDNIWEVIEWYVAGNGYH